MIVPARFAVEFPVSIIYIVVFIKRNIFAARDTLFQISIPAVDTDELRFPAALDLNQLFRTFALETGLHTHVVLRVVEFHT